MGIQLSHDSKIGDEWDFVATPEQIRHDPHILYVSEQLRPLALWCRENIDGRFKAKITKSEYKSSFHGLLFEKREDAIYFKMTWC